MTEEKLPGDLVKGPAIGLMVTGGLGFVWGLFSMIRSVVSGGGSMPTEGLEEMPEAVVNALEFLSSTAGAILFGLIGLALNGLLIYGGMQMKNLQSRGLAMAASIVALIPCGVCCLLGWPFGIWSLVVLNKPEVKQAFN